MPIKPNGFSDGLASLRGIAAAVVVVFHAQLIFRVADFDDPHRMGIELDDPLRLLKIAILDLFNGPSAVVLFFVLSGTVLAMSLDRGRALTGADWAAYYIRRAFRLLPLLVVVALAAAAMHYLYFEDVDYTVTTTWMDGYYSHDPGAAEVARNALGLSNSLNSPAWTIRIELAASILFPIFYLLGGPWPITLLTSAALIALMFLDLPLEFVHVYLFAFYLGSLLPTRAAAAVAVYRRWPRVVRAGVVLGVLALMAGFQRVHRHWVFVDPTSVLVVTLCAAVLVAIVLHGPANRFLRSRLFVWLGDISYGLYLIHFAVLFALAHLVAPRVEASGLTAWQALGLNMGLAVATLALTIPLATASYHLLEKPFQEFGRRVARSFQGRSPDRNGKRQMQAGD